ncbi:MAG: DUF2461 domain-containing protein [Clostridiales bacterium]|nr:DUF2461 domain-containing protein [Clostridiales bacterium]
MSAFQGISAEAMWLLAENRFHDSREYYEEHKADIRRQVLEPLRALLEDLSPALLKMDSRLIAEPGRNGCISRIRRDNRYSRDKSLYRENVWVCFMRDKKAWDCLPGFFVDMSLRQSSYGVGFYSTPPALMRTLRRMMEEMPGRFEKAAKQALAAGFSIEGERYARPRREGLPPLMDELYNRKNIDFIQKEDGPAFFSGPELVERLKTGFQALEPAYCLLIEAVERERAERGRE